MFSDNPVQGRFCSNVVGISKVDWKLRSSRPDRPPRSIRSMIGAWKHIYAVLRYCITR